MHGYQEYCVSFIRDNPQSMMILSMGLGKTVISLTAITDLLFDSFEVSRVLVIAPLRVCTSVWPREKESWEHTSLLEMSVIT